MPPKKGTTLATTKKSQVKTLSTSAKKKENNSTSIPLATRVKKPTANKASKLVPVEELTIRRSTRHVPQQEEHAIVGGSVASPQAPQPEAVNMGPDSSIDTGATKCTIRSNVTTAPKATKPRTTAVQKTLTAVQKTATATTARKTTTATLKTTTTVSKTVAVPKTATTIPKTIAASKTATAISKTAAASKTTTSRTATVSKTAVKPTTTVESSLVGPEKLTSASAYANIPQQFLEEMALLKAQLAQSEAQVGKYKNDTSAKVVHTEEIPEPTGDYNLQIAMGLRDDKEAYNECRAAVKSVMAQLKVPINIDWRRQDCVSVAKAFTMVKELEPRLAGFEKNWPIAAIMRTANKNKRGYKVKRAKKYISPKRRKQNLAGEAGLDTNEDDHQHNNDNEAVVEEIDAEEATVEGDDIEDDTEEADIVAADVKDTDVEEIDAEENGVEEIDMEEVEVDAEEVEVDVEEVEVDAEEVDAEEVDVEEVDAEEVDAEEAGLDREMSGSEDGNGGGIDEEECKHRRQFLKRRRLSTDTESDKKVTVKPRKKRTM